MVAEEDAPVPQGFNFASDLCQHVDPGHGADVGQYYSVLHFHVLRVGYGQSQDCKDFRGEGVCFTGMERTDGIRETAAKACKPIRVIERMCAK